MGTCRCIGICVCVCTRICIWIRICKRQCNCIRKAYEYVYAHAYAYPYAYNVYVDVYVYVYRAQDRVSLSIRSPISRVLEKPRYSSAVSACEKGERWELALQLLLELHQATVEGNAALIDHAKAVL